MHCGGACEDLGHLMYTINHVGGVLSICDILHSNKILVGQMSSYQGVGLGGWYLEESRKSQSVLEQLL